MLLSYADAVDDCMRECVRPCMSVCVYVYIYTDVGGVVHNRSETSADICKLLSIR